MKFVCDYCGRDIDVSKQDAMLFWDVGKPVRNKLPARGLTISHKGFVDGHEMMPDLGWSVELIWFASRPVAEARRILKMYSFDNASKLKMNAILQMAGESHE